MEKPRQRVLMDISPRKVPVGVNSTTISSDVAQFEPHHYAFLVDDQEFDAILRRVKQAGLEYSAYPLHKEPNQVNYLEGGRGFYFRELNRPRPGSANAALKH